MRRRSQDLRRSAAEHDVLRLDLELVRDRFDELGAAVERVAARGRAVGAKRSPDSIEHGLARPERVFVAGQDDRARLHRAERLLDERPHAMFTAPRSDVGARQHAGRTDSECLNECTSRKRHGSPPTAACRSTLTSRTGARCGTLRWPSASRPSCRAKCARASSRRAGSRGRP